MHSPYMKEKNSSNEILFYLIFFMIKHKYILGIHNIQHIQWSIDFIPDTILYILTVT